jgi:ornithine cyclodeaminase
LSDTAIDFLYLSEPDMIAAGVTDMSACVDAMEQTFALLHRGDYRMSGSNHDSHGALINFPDESPFPTMPRNGADRRFMAMPAYLGGDFGTTGVKWYGSNLANQAKGLPRSILMFMLNDTDTGAPLALMSANLLSAYRTGAVPGVGARFLAQPDSRVVGIVGPGVIGRSSLAAFITACPKVDTVVEVAVATTRTVAHRTKELGVLGATECRAHRWWPRCSSSPSSPLCSAQSRARRWP